MVREKLEKLQKARGRGLFPRPLKKSGPERTERHTDGFPVVKRSPITDPELIPEGRWK